MVERLIRCTQCNQVIPHFESFGDFGEESELPGVEWCSDDLEEQKSFSERHRGHALEELSVDRDSLVSDKPSYEPVKVAYVEASNGRRKFLIKRTRASFDRPVSYEVVPGKLKVTDVSLEIREEELQKEITWLNGSFPLHRDKVRKFIDAFREEVKSVPPDRLDSEMEMTLPGETALLGFGSLSQAHWDRVLERCQPEFQEAEMELVENFIQKNCRPVEPLGLQIHKAISISPAP